MTVLSKLLERRTKPYVDGKEEAFRKEIQAEAEKLASVPFGVPLMHIIG